ncbi:MAG: DUF4956 domain-containing protein [Spirochaetota bacterium]
MTERLNSILLVAPEQLTDFGISLVLAVALGFAIAAVYRYTHRSMSYESSFPQTLVLLTPIVTIVMFFIQGDLVLSLGLVGSLSIVRFRTPIKDTKDMVFLFWAIVTGLGCGTLHWTLALLSTGSLSLLMAVFYLARYGRRTHAEYIMIVAGGMPSDEHALSELIGGAGLSAQLRSHEFEGSRWELTYELRVARGSEDRIHQTVSRVRSMQGVEKVSLLAPHLSLPL